MADSTNRDSAGPPRRARAFPRHHDLMVFGVALGLLLWMAPSLANYLNNPDHGYQLSLARLVTLGGFPFIDQIFHYGPLVAWSSALVLWLSGGLIGETLLCATGYAAALTCLANTARARLGLLAGWLVPLVALLFLARFYKWYFWLFPAITLVLYNRYLERRMSTARSLFLAGVVAGSCALFRLDLGVVLLTFWAIVALTGRVGWFQKGAAVGALWVGVGFLLPMIVWFGVLGSVGGIGAVQGYLSATLDGGSGVVGGWSHGAAPFDIHAPFSSASGLALALWVLPIGLLAGLAIGGWRSLHQTGRPQLDARFLAGASILGIGLLPQAFYRADGQHLLQALPPFFLVVPLVARELLREFGLHGPRAAQTGRLWLAAAGMLLVVAGIGVRSYGGWDLAPLDSNGFARLEQTWRGLGSESSYPIARLVRQITSITPVDARILVVPIVPQVYYFAERSMSGLLNQYAPHILDDPKWRRLNFEHVLAHPPAAVLVTAVWLNPQSRDAQILRDSHPELDAYLRSHYSVVTQRMTQRGSWRILRPDPRRRPK